MKKTHETAIRRVHAQWSRMCRIQAVGVNMVIVCLCKDQDHKD
jgi:hypothetical protein